jgi:hypothetical protein
LPAGILGTAHQRPHQACLLAGGERVLEHDQDRVRAFVGPRPNACLYTRTVSVEISNSGLGAASLFPRSSGRGGAVGDTDGADIASVKYPLSVSI